MKELLKKMKKELESYSKVYGAKSSELARSIGTNNPTIIELANIDEDLEIIEKNKNKANRIRLKEGD